MMHVKFRNVNEAFTEIVGGINNGSIPTIRTSSRNGDVLQIVEPVIITYSHPRERVLFNELRDANSFFHLFESLWMLAGRDNVAPIAFYAKNMLNYSDDGIELNGAYGFRWRYADHYPSTVDQLSRLIDHLRNKPDSRRAVLQMWNVGDDLLKIGDMTCNYCQGTKRGLDKVGSFPAVDESYACPRCQGSGLEPGSKDVCCNLSVCFSIRVLESDQIDASLMGEPAGTRMMTGLIRKAALDMTVFNRSNDLIWGALGANVVHFSMLQEYMADCLGVKVGVYNQVSNNMHVYVNNWKPEEWLNTPRVSNLVCNIPLVKSKERFDIEVSQFVNTYWTTDRVAFNDDLVYHEPFLREVARPMCRAFAKHKQRDYVMAYYYMEQVEADDWRQAGVEWIRRRRVAYSNKERTDVKNPS